MAKTITAVTALLTLTGPALAQPAAETTRPGRSSPGAQAPTATRTAPTSANAQTPTAASPCGGRAAVAVGTPGSGA
jgi:hypothetical protein